MGRAPTSADAGRVPEPAGLGGAGCGGGCGGDAAPARPHSSPFPSPAVEPKLGRCGLGVIVGVGFAANAAG